MHLNWNSFTFIYTVFLQSFLIMLVIERSGFLEVYGPGYNNLEAKDINILGIWSPILLQHIPENSSLTYWNSVRDDS